MSTVLLTIAGPDKRVDLAAPSDTPIEQLLPTFLEMTDAEPGSEWRVGLPGRGPLPGDRTLEDCGVVDGALLEIQRARTVPAEQEAADAPDYEPGAGTPLQRARGTLPGRLGRPRRMAAAASAALRRETPEPVPRSVQPPGGEELMNPAVVTVARPRTPLERAQSSWRETDYLRRLDREIGRPRLRRCATIAVASPKGGVGKTTITALLGSLLAHTRRDRTVAVDTNPDYGSLGRTLTPDHGVFVDDLLDQLGGGDLTATQLDAQLGRGPDGLLVLPAPTEPSRMSRLDRTAYQRVIEHLQTKAGVLLLDCGTGLQEPAAQAAIMAADQLVLVSDAEPATSTLVAEASRLLLRSGVPLMLVVNKFPRRSARLNLEALERLVPGAAGMATLDAHPAGAARVATGSFTWTEPAAGWERGVRELAVALVAQWDDLGLTAPADNAVIVR